MPTKALITSLKTQALALEQSSEQLALLTRRLPKHRIIVRSLSRTLLSASLYLSSVAAHIQRDAEAA